MRFLVLVALVAAVSADYHDDTFHFSSLSGQTGLKKSSFAQAPAAPLPLRKVSTTSFVAQPAYQQQVLVKQVPVYTQIAHPVVHIAHAQPTLHIAHAAPALHISHAPIIAHAAPAVHIAHAAPAVHIAHAAPVVHIAHAQPAVTQYSAQYSSSSSPQFRILSQTQEVDPSGPYKLSYNTENGIQVQEQGALVPSAEGAAVAAQGSYAFSAPDGSSYSVSYIADENGFRASGDHLPTPPPIPAEILKSLEENARSGEQYDDQGRLLRN